MKEGNVLFNNVLNRFVYGYIASDIWYMAIQIAREETMSYISLLRCMITIMINLTGYEFLVSTVLYLTRHKQCAVDHQHQQWIITWIKLLWFVCVYFGGSYFANLLFIDKNNIFICNSPTLYILKQEWLGNLLLWRLESPWILEYSDTGRD